MADVKKKNGSDWKEAVKLYLTVEARSGYILKFPIRGSSAKNIAKYLLDNCSVYLIDGEKLVLQQILDK